MSNALFNSPVEMGLEITGTICIQNVSAERIWVFVM